MENTNKEERSCASCKQFMDAIGVGSVVRAIRDASHGRQRPVAATVVPAAASASNPNPAKKIVEPSTGPETKPGAGLNEPPSFAIKIENHRPLGPAPEKTGQIGGKKVEIQVQPVEGNEKRVNIDERFTEFLNRAKSRMRTFSDIGGGNTLSRKESNKDHFTEYINRAKNKLRTTSNVGDAKSNTRTIPDIGGGNTLSRKESNKDHFMEYINRAKNKLRTTSNVGGAKNSASK